MKILLCIVLLLVVLTLFAVWPGKRRDALRAPFLGRNCAHRGFFGSKPFSRANDLLVRQGADPVDWRVG